MQTLAKWSFFVVALISLGASSSHGQVVGDRFDGALIKEAMRSFVGPDGICQESTGRSFGTGPLSTSRSCVTTTPGYELVAKGSETELVAWVQWNEGKISEEELKPLLTKLFTFVQRFGFDAAVVRSCTTEATKSSAGVRRVIPNAILECRNNTAQLVMELKVPAAKPKSDF